MVKKKSLKNWPKNSVFRAKNAVFCEKISVFGHGLSVKGGRGTPPFPLTFWQLTVREGGGEYPPFPLTFQENVVRDGPPNGQFPWLGLLNPSRLSYSVTREPIELSGQRCKKWQAWQARLCYFFYSSCANFWAVDTQLILGKSTCRACATVLIFTLFATLLESGIP